jgi:cytochrome c-type biogenesis protein CcmH
VKVESTAAALTPAEKAELDRLLSRASDSNSTSTDSTDHDISSPEDKK